MKKTLMMLPILITVLAVSAYSADNIGPKMGNLPVMIGNEPLPDVSGNPSQPGVITDSPGEIVGWTQYDYQTNGSTGRRIVLDSQGGAHFAWMNGTSYPDDREVDFNFVDANGNWLVPEQGVTVSQQNGAGYVQLGMTSDDRAAVAYHQWMVADYVVLAMDNFPGMGIFSYFDPPDMLVERCYWPYLTVDRNDNIHIVGCENPAEGEQAIGYTRSTDGGDTWSRIQPVDTLMVISQNVVSSPVSDKVAIVYTHPRDYLSQWYNDIYYIESEDGLSWDWIDGKVNVTDYGSGEETFWAYTDLAAVYDYNDNLNIIWNALVAVDDDLYYPVHLIHFSSGSGMMTTIEMSPEEWPDAGCETGAWNLQIAKMSLAVQEGTNALYSVYTAFDPEDCSVGGFANGDIYMNYSVDGGASWSAAENMTDSQTPGCSVGNCDSDHWSTVAERVDESLHIVYTNDKDAGGIPQTEGSATDNPIMYLAYPLGPLSVENGLRVPEHFTLAQNYPNPFNAQTTIEFELKEAMIVELAVYDVTGAKTAELYNGNLDAGTHLVNWDAEDVASGVYYYTLSTDSETRTRKMILLK